MIFAMATKVRHRLSLCLVLVIFATSAKADWSADELQKVKDNMVEAANSSSPSKSLLDKALNKLNVSNGFFSDLEYDGFASFKAHAKRQNIFLYHHHAETKDLKKEIISSFSYITYKAPKHDDSNWWRHLIALPSNMWEGAVLAKGVIEDKLLFDFLDKFWVNTSFGAVWQPENYSGSMAGGNLGPRAMLAEVEGLLRGTHQKVHAEVQEALHRELALREPFDGNGLVQDGCLHQHNIPGNSETVNKQYLNHTLGNIYNSNYGKELLRYVSNLMSWYNDTSVDFRDDTIEGLFAAYLECHQWLFRGHTVEPTTCGRQIDDDSTVTDSSRGSVLFTGMNLQKLGRHKKEIESVLHRYHNTTPDFHYALIGNKHFFKSDLTVHQRREFMASVRILSNRTTRPESWPHDNKNSNGYFQADGFLTVLVDGNEYGKPKNEIFPKYDWAKVPGVTNSYTKVILQHKTGRKWAETCFNNATFVGGVSDGMVGVVAMDYARPHEPLRHFKSWFFFDDVIVALGSNIALGKEDATEESVITTLAQLVFDGKYVLATSSGEELKLDFGSNTEKLPKWLHHRNIGYVFLNGNEKLHTSAETRVHGDDYIDVFTAWLDHGSTPEDARHGFAVLPAADLKKTREFAAELPVQVISQNRELHAVCHQPSKTIGAALAKAEGKVAASCGSSSQLTFQVDTPCIALITVKEETPDFVSLKVTLADPQQIYDAVAIQVTSNGRQVEKTVNLPPAPKKGSSVTVLINV